MRTGLTKHEIARFHNDLEEAGEITEKILSALSKRYMVSVDTLKRLTPKAFKKAKVDQSEIDAKIKDEATTQAAEIAAKTINKIAEGQARKSVSKEK